MGAILVDKEEAQVEGSSAGEAAERPVAAEDLVVVVVAEAKAVAGARRQKPLQSPSQ